MDAILVIHGPCGRLNIEHPTSNIERRWVFFADARRFIAGFGGANAGDENPNQFVGFLD
jgi:hypothetical protein